MVVRCAVLGVAGVMLLTAGTGCFQRKGYIAEEQRVAVDRGVVEYPAGYRLEVVVDGLSGPSAICFDVEGNMLIAEGGLDGGEPRIRGFRKGSGEEFQIYPGARLGVPLTGLRTGFRIWGPVGGMVAHEGRVFVSHRDERGKGVITSFGYDGSHETVVAQLPAEGDHGVTDLAISPSGRLYFGVGTATNSGVVGVDNWQAGWAKKNKGAADRSWVDLKLLGYRFDSENPGKGWFGSEIAVTAPFQPFGVARQLRVAREPSGRPNGAIYSVSPLGGDLRVEAHGIRYPRGLAFNEFGRLFITNNGMELRGTRPVANDPDAVVRFVPGAWYGWPDYSTEFVSVADGKYQPPTDLVEKHGYPENAAVIDHAASGLIKPDPGALLHVVLPVQSGAAKVAFVPGTGAAAEAFGNYRGSMMVALAGDRGPTANGGKPPTEWAGYRVVEVTESRQVREMIRNVIVGPAWKGDRKAYEGLRRPIDVKFGPDGALYIVDVGRLEWSKGRANVWGGTGRVWRLVRG